MSDAFLAAPAADDGQPPSVASKAPCRSAGIQYSHAQPVMPASSSVSGTISDAPRTPAEAPGTPAGGNSPSPRHRQSSSPSLPSSLVASASLRVPGTPVPAAQPPMAPPEPLQVSLGDITIQLTLPASAWSCVACARVHICLLLSAGAHRLRSPASPGSHGRLQRILRLASRRASWATVGKAGITGSGPGRRRGPCRGG